MRGKKHEKKFFPETHEYREQKTMDKNRLERVRKRVFYKHANIVTKKWVEKTREKNFPERHVYREQKTMEKIVWKKCENRFFIDTRISGPTNAGK